MISGSFAKNDLQLKATYESDIKGRHRQPPPHSLKSHIISGPFAKNNLQLKASYESDIKGRHCQPPPQAKYNWYETTKQPHTIALILSTNSDRHLHKTATDHRALLQKERPV